MVPVHAGVNAAIRLCRGCRFVVTLLALALCAAFPRVAAFAQPAPIPSVESVPSVSPPHLTVVVFADQPMPSAQWTALFSAMRAQLDEEDQQTQSLDRNAEFIEGDRMPLGLSVDSSITVYLHGDCRLAPLQRRTAFGVPLGWVLRVDGRVEPFAHVDCTRIGQVLGPQARLLSDQRRVDVMARAMARVILHEWIHIATQNRKHTETGIAKAEFGVADLMGGDRGGIGPMKTTRSDESPRSRAGGGR
jgi:hypothetical protein